MSSLNKLKPVHPRLICHCLYCPKSCLNQSLMFTDVLRDSWQPSLPLLVQTLVCHSPVGCGVAWAGVMVNGLLNVLSNGACSELIISAPSALPQWAADLLQGSNGYLRPSCPHGSPCCPPPPTLMTVIQTKHIYMYRPCTQISLTWFI